MQIRTRVVAAILFIFVVIGALSVGDVAAQGTIPPAPVKEWLVFLPSLSDNAFPQEMPPVVEGEPSYMTKAVNVDVWMGGAPGSSTEFMRATTLLTFWSWREDGTRDAAICWYGTWPDGGGAARCDLYPAGEEGSRYDFLGTPLGDEGRLSTRFAHRMMGFTFRSRF